MAEWEVDKRQNERVDGLTHRFNDPVALTVNNVEDLPALRREWAKLESIPCFVAGRDAAADHSWSGMDVRTLLSGDNSSGRLSYHDIVVAPGSGLPPHFQDSAHTFIYVVDGAIDLTIGHLSEHSERGTVGYAPARTTQGFLNTGTAPARLFVTYAPAGADRAFHDAHQHFLASDDTVKEPYLAILSRYGFNFDITGPLENDSRTNLKPERIEYQIEALKDYEALRDVWAHRDAIPKLVHSYESCPGVETALSKSNVVVTGDECIGAGAMFRSNWQPGYGAFAHFQPIEEEIFYVLEGRPTLTCGTDTREVGPGAFGFAPRGATHGFLNTGNSVAHMITMNTPAGHERGFEMIMREAKAPSGRFDELFVAHGWRKVEAA